MTIEIPNSEIEAACKAYRKSEYNDHMLRECIISALKAAAEVRLTQAPPSDTVLLQHTEKQVIEDFIKAVGKGQPISQLQFDRARKALGIDSGKDTCPTPKSEVTPNEVTPNNDQSVVQQYEGKHEAIIRCEMGIGKTQAMATGLGSPDPKKVINNLDLAKSLAPILKSHLSDKWQSFTIELNAKMEEDNVLIMGLGLRK